MGEKREGCVEEMGARLFSQWVLEGRGPCLFHVCILGFSTGTRFAWMINYPHNLLSLICKHMCPSSGTMHLNASWFHLFGFFIFNYFLHNSQQKCIFLLTGRAWTFDLPIYSLMGLRWKWGNEAFIRRVSIRCMFTWGLLICYLPFLRVFVLKLAAWHSPGTFQPVGKKKMLKYCGKCLSTFQMINWFCDVLEKEVGETPRNWSLMVIQSSSSYLKTTCI